MRWLFVCVAMLSVVLPRSANGGESDRFKSLLSTHCLDCHSGDAAEASVDLSGPHDQLAMLKGKSVWNRVLDQLESRSMPPDAAGSGDGPSDADYDALAGHIRTKVQDVDWRQFHSPGRIDLARLTTAEYRNSVRDLFGVDVQAGQFLGADPEGGTGFTNDRDSLTFPLFALDNFLREAERTADVVLSYQRPRWSRTYNAVEAWKASSERSVAPTADGRAILLKTRNAPYRLDLDLPFAAMYDLTIRAACVTNDPVSSLSVVVNGQQAGRIVVRGKQQSDYTLRLNLPAGANVVTMGFDPDYAPIFQQIQKPRTVPKSITKRVSTAGIKKLALPDRLSENERATDAWRKLNNLLRSYIITQRLAEHLLATDRVDFEQHDMVAGQYRHARTFLTTKVPFNLAAGSVSVFAGIPQAELEKKIKREIGYSHDEYRAIANKLRSVWKARNPHRVRKVPGSIGISEVRVASHALRAGETDPGPKLSAAFQSEIAARRFLSDLSSRAYARPVSDDELDRLLLVFRETKQETGSAQDGLRDAIVGLLVSPPFLLRYYEPNVDNSNSLSTHDLAERLSRFLWLSIPDDELRRLADGNRLSDPSVLDRQIDRLIASPKFESTIAVFVQEWLDLDSLTAHEKSRKIKPHIVSAMRQEPVLLMQDIVRNDRSLLTFIQSDFTYLNDSLAFHYGVPGIDGQQMRPVPLPDERRGGLLAMAGILTSTSTQERTSPVRRGAFIVELLLGEELPPPPDDVPELVVDATTRTVREEMERHRASPACAGCHQRIDPFGLVLEHYDQFGRWRDRDAGKPVLASTKLADGTAIDGLGEFQSYLVTERGDDFIRGLTERMFEFAIGREATFSDEATLKTIVTNVITDDCSARTLIREIVRCDAFQSQSD